MRRTTSLSLAIAIALATSTIAHAQFGDILNRGKKASDKAKKVADATAVWTPEQEQAIGEASAAKLVHIFGLYDNPAMQHYVNLVGHAVAGHSSRAGSMKYKFGILDTEAITAFGIPGGYVFITRGALANLQDEAELAGTLAHEVAHVDNRHLEKEIRAKKLTGLATSEAMDQVGNRVPFGSMLKEVANEVVTQAVTMSYSRDKEEEADRKGTELAATAGYDANGLRKFLTTIQAAAQADAEAERRLGVWGSTHPPLTERIATLSNVASKFNGGATLQARYEENASFGPSKAELERIAAEKAAAEKAATEKAAAEKAAADKSKSGAGTSPKAKAKRRPQ
jgi:beta-barrel assembly-enhancing protease